MTPPARPRRDDRAGDPRRREPGRGEPARAGAGRSGPRRDTRAGAGTGSRTTYRAAPARTRPTHRLEVTFLPGLADVVADEVTELLSPVRPPVPVPGRDDALLVTHTGALDDPRLLRLRTAVAVFAVLTFDVPRPRSLVSGEHLPRIAAALDASVRLGAARSFRFEAAGRDSAVFQRLAAELSSATRMRHDEDEGEVVVRFRRTPRTPGSDRGPAAGGEPGWDVLVRLGGRPLSARTWRVTDYPGAVNATIAAAIARMAGVRPEDRVVNLMSGSGTLLVERLLAGPAAVAVAVDNAPEAVSATTDNLAAAGFGRTARVDHADVLSPKGAWRALGPFDLVLADPPWGSLHGSHATSAEVHTGLLRAAHEVCAPGGRLVVLTHEITIMERCLRAASGEWQERAAMRVFAKGHHPRVYVLDRR